MVESADGRPSRTLIRPEAWCQGVPSSALREKAKTVPLQPGVYLWKDAGGAVLYVGKAGVLRNRVLQYFGPQEDERKAEMMERATDLEFLAVATVKEALVLEQNLIKRHMPPYNVLLKDDKRYPYIAITNEAWPRVVYTRDLDLKGAFFGPFPDAWKAKRVARMLNQTFKLRQCRELPKRECLYYHMHQCTAPCIAAVAPQDYERQVTAAQAFLKGRGPELRERLRAEMDQASKDLRFERAAELRDLDEAVGSVLERQRVDTMHGEDYDALGLAESGGRWCAVVLPVRAGQLAGREHYFLNAPVGTPAPAVAEGFLEQFYLGAPRMPKEVQLPVPMDGPGPLAEILGEIHGHRVKLHTPERGPRRRFVDLAESNARLLLEQEFLLRERRGPEAVEALQKALQLADAPSTIECFDISHHGGEHTVASLVVMKDGKPFKAGYRKFKMKTVSGGDDPAAMREVVLRRYTRVLEEDGADALPDLIIVDGGRIQVDAAHAALKDLGLDETPLIGLAKKHEEIVRPRILHNLKLEPSNPGLHLLMRARDEAHRFAIRYQGTLKNKAFLASELDDIPGVGDERRRRLLSTFGSLEGLREATVDEIARVPGVNRTVAKKIHEALHAPQASDTGADAGPKSS